MSVELINMDNTIFMRGMMYYLVYKITNTVNNKIYIGRHRTENIDDGYMGSGLIIKLAINKYGKEKFIKEILYNFDDEQEMITMEKTIIDVDFVNRCDTYNIETGGDGSWHSVNSTGRNYSKNRTEWTEEERKQRSNAGKKGMTLLREKMKTDEDFKKACIDKYRKSMQEYYKTHDGSFKGKQHTEETKNKIGQSNSVHQRGIKNSQFGTCWVWHEELKINKKINKEDLIKWLDKGWNKGRKMKF